jgi:hypothetical protein
MRTITTTLYKFDELTEDAKRKAIQRLNDINTMFEWWEYIYEYAEEVGIEIIGFNIDNGDISIKFEESIEKTMQLILSEHGEICDTNKLAKQYLSERKQLEQQYKGIDLEDKLSFVDPDFTQQLEKCYLKLLQEDYDYRTSDEAIIEGIQANEYEFTEDGNLYKC